MRENVIRQSRHYAQLAFMTLVTAWLLAAVFIQASRGVAGIFGVVAFALAAGFGLEFVSAGWTNRRSRAARSASHG
ncbi:MAG: hypothetical protein ACR2HC_00510 [Thermoleophilaceae bacterium]